MYLYSHLCKSMFILGIMCMDQVQQQYYYKGLIRVMTQHGSQAIRIHVYPARYYKSKPTHLLKGLVQLLLSSSDQFGFMLV